MMHKGPFASPQEVSLNDKKMREHRMRMMEGERTEPLDDGKNKKLNDYGIEKI